ncbi:hypothetical protein C0J52_02017 [Blattella germanica]|nr:hypothetical protein C0J52_02017 [Blattella germanica]
MNWWVHSLVDSVQILPHMALAVVVHIVPVFLTTFLITRALDKHNLPEPSKKPLNLQPNIAPWLQRMQFGNGSMKEEGDGRKRASLNCRMYWQSSRGGKASVRQYEKESSRTSEDEISLNLIGIEYNFKMGTCFETKANKM